MTPYERHHQNGHLPGDAMDPRDELAWTALLYSVGELPEDEIAGFEARLESDPLAQAALAQAVALSAGVILAEASVPARAMPVTIATRRYENLGRRVAGWMLFVTAACVVLSLSYRPDPAMVQNIRANKAHVLSVMAAEAERELAAAWVAGQPTEDELVIVDEPIPEEELLAEAETMPVIEEPSAPDWLIAALVDAQTSPLRGEN